MCTSDRTQQERGMLGFSEGVRTNLGFLKQYGFREVDAEDTIIRYATERVFLNVYHGRSSYELGIEVGLVAEMDKRGYPLGAFVRLTDPEEGARLRYVCATTAEEVRTGLQRLAAQVERYVKRALKGDETIFSELAQQQREWAAAYVADLAYEQVSPKAAEAFREKRYGEAAKLYESIENRLSPAELTKLEYAKQHR